MVVCRCSYLVRKYLAAVWLKPYFDILYNSEIAVYTIKPPTNSVLLFRSAKLWLLTARSSESGSRTPTITYERLRMNICRLLFIPASI
jgi:hypothetical protein